MVAQSSTPLQPLLWGLYLPRTVSIRLPGRTLKTGVLCGRGGWFRSLIRAGPCRWSSARLCPDFVPVAVDENHHRAAADFAVVIEFHRQFLRRRCDDLKAQKAGRTGEVDETGWQGIFPCRCREAWLSRQPQLSSGGSSAGQSNGFLNRRSRVRVPPTAPAAHVSRGETTARCGAAVIDEGGRPALPDLGSYGAAGQGLRPLVLPLILTPTRLRQ